MRAFPARSTSDINAINNSGDCAFSQSCFNGLTEIVDSLLKAPKLDVNLKNKNGDSGLYLACFKKHIEVSLLLIEQCESKNIDINAINNLGDNAFYQACLNGLTEVVDKFLKAPAFRYTPTRNIHGNTEFHQASSHGHIEIIRLLLQASDIRLISQGFLWSCEIGNAELTRNLLNESDIKGIDVYLNFLGSAYDNSTIDLTMAEGGGFAIEITVTK